MPGRVQDTAARRMTGTAKLAGSLACATSNSATSATPTSTPDSAPQPFRLYERPLALLGPN
ncbi:hypothetical protein [Streptomyces phaeochromogenes]|uniref:hypothetical protein n=1 Tax=Streptomyces phaeochromogenes TaxID=1923 RepID=UPI0038645127|nr:hypothetical protein OG277_53190 [Streptomyces phaeochromogenes]